jgi:hypothetical protein
MRRNVDLWAVALLMLVMAVATEISRFGMEVGRGRRVVVVDRNGHMTASPALPQIPELPNIPELPRVVVTQD